MLVDSITIDGLDEHEFRRSIENMLRHGEADGAASRLRALLEPYARDGGILPARFLSVSSRDVTIRGWDRLADRMAQYDRPPHRVSALSIAVVDTDPDGNVARPDEAGRLTPYVETGYYCDEAYPFSEADRNDLLDGYSLYGCEWQGNFEASDSTLAIDGIDDLYGAVAQLEARLINSREPAIDEICAGSVGACYLSVLVHQAVRDRISSDGLPRALCVMAGSNGIYPYFDAPVISSEEYREKVAVTTLDAAPTRALDSGEAESPVMAEGDYESLLTMQSRKGKKKPVLVLDAAETANKAREEELAAAAAAQVTEVARHTAVNLLKDLETFYPSEQEEPFGHSASPNDAEFFENMAASTEADDGLVDHAFESNYAGPANPYALPAEPEASCAEEDLYEDEEDAAAPPEVAKTAPAPAPEPEPAPEPVAEKFEPLPPFPSAASAEPPAAPPRFEAEWPETPSFEDRFEPLPQPAEIEAPEPIASPARPAPAASGHRLRAQIARSEESRTTMGQVLLAWLQRLGEWLARKRKAGGD